MSWATIEDLYARSGEEFIHKLGIRRNWDAETETWVASEDDVSVTKVVNIALEDAKNLILQKLACLYLDYNLVNQASFPVIKQWHIKMTVEVLRANGDCLACDCKALDEFLGCGSVCTPDGVCLSGTSSVISVSTPHYPCEACNCGSCECCH